MDMSSSAARAMSPVSSAFPALIGLILAIRVSHHAARDERGGAQNNERNAGDGGNRGHAEADADTHSSSFGGAPGHRAGVNLSRLKAQSIGSDRWPASPE
jgi:hypothetical protein